jgi:hypothetical protein
MTKRTSRRVSKLLLASIILLSIASAVGCGKSNDAAATAPVGTTGSGSNKEDNVRAANALSGANSAVQSGSQGTSQ